MGIPFFCAFVYEYLIESIDRLRQINLTNENVVIDGNSFLHFIYDTKWKPDNKALVARQCTGHPFNYHAYWKKYDDLLRLFRSNVTVVFDGIGKKNLSQRNDPRSNSPYVTDDAKQDRLPNLLRHEFYDILRKLDIQTIVAPGEADPVIVSKARELNAYVVSYDTDFHLYELPKGFVSLRYLNLDTLTGPCFQLADVFGNIGQGGAALWATVIGNKFIELETLQTVCPMVDRWEKNKFYYWLQKNNPGEDRCKWALAQLHILRFIQQSGTDAAYKQLIEHVKENERSQFNQIMHSFVRIEQNMSFNTADEQVCPPHFEERFFKGEFDRKLMKILINKDLSTWQKLSPLNFQLLLPICHILLQAIHNNSSSSTISYNERQYNLSETFQNKNLPLLDDVPCLEKCEQQKYVLYCIDFALGGKGIICWDKVNNDYVFWLSLLKLWYYRRMEQTSLFKSILYGLIVAFVPQVCLDIYDESERHATDQSLSPPFLQYSPYQLKTQFSPETCKDLREKIDCYCENASSIEPITSALHQFEEIYKNLTMVNQFFAYPLPMLSPHQCINNLTYRLAIIFSESENIKADLHRLFAPHKLLVDTTQEIFRFVTNS